MAAILGQERAALVALCTDASPEVAAVANRLLDICDGVQE
jgi:hypothetical protein